MLRGMTQAAHTFETTERPAPTNADTQRVLLNKHPTGGLLRMSASLVPVQESAHAALRRQSTLSHTDETRQYQLISYVPSLRRVSLSLCAGLRPEKHQAWMVGASSISGGHAARQPRCDRQWRPWRWRPGQSYRTIPGIRCCAR